jgi:hypothetical protein
VGEEVHFTLPADLKPGAGGRKVVDPGTVRYRVQGGSLALPYGPTPVLRVNECRLVTKVDVPGRIEGEPRRLATVRDGDAIEVTQA